ncbi:hypothetical protein ADUPG1_014080 [Aduncisulcus paluster]|uniref:Uncharacterized protein n=1 Tax=Aduncisulcus paluster TaxID=2918883 RepID=A0ABQ5KCS8_9EUKA|nr:hypothetical protein ADUPG1_014080 [Aduncisulcus paluster]
MRARESSLQSLSSSSGFSEEPIPFSPRKTHQPLNIAVFGCGITMHRVLKRVCEELPDDFSVSFLIYVRNVESERVKSTSEYMSSISSSITATIKSIPELRKQKEDYEESQRNPSVSTCPIKNPIIEVKTGAISDSGTQSTSSISQRLQIPIHRVKKQSMSALSPLSKVEYPDLILSAVPSEAGAVYLDLLKFYSSSMVPALSLSPLSPIIMSFSEWSSTKLFKGLLIPCVVSHELEGEGSEKGIEDRTKVSDFMFKYIQHQQKTRGEGTQSDSMEKAEDSKSLLEKDAVFRRTADIILAQAYSIFRTSRPASRLLERIESTTDKES